MRGVSMAAALLLFCSVQAASAQERQFGGKLGVSFSSVAIEPAEADPGYGTRVGAAGGAFLVAPVSGPLAVQFEALYGSRGGKLDLDSDVSSTLILDYVEFPLLARLTAMRSASRAFHVFAGPSAGLRLRARQQLSQSGTGFSGGFEDDISPDVKRFELGMVAGAGVDIGRHLVIDGRYFRGLTNVSRDSTAGTLRNRTVTFMAGYRF